MAAVGGQSRDSLEPAELVNRTDLQRLQDNFATVAKVFVFCVDVDGRRMTEMSGPPDEVNRILSILSEKHLIGVINRVTGSSIEEQVVEDTEFSNIKIASISIRVEGKPVINWFLCGVIEDVDLNSESAALNFTHTITKASFMDSLDLLRNFSVQLFGSKLAAARATSESARSQTSERAMSRELRRSEIMTEVVQMLESEASFEKIANDILNLTGTFINLSHAYVMRAGRDGDSVDIIGMWENKQAVSLLDGIKSMTHDEFLVLNEKVIVISAKTKISDADRASMTARNIKAMIVMPIFVNGKIAMYTLFTESEKERNWELDEVKFLGDVTKILQSILTRRIQKNSLASSYASLEAILDNVGSAIYVRDIETNEVLFANRIFRNTFDSEIRDGSINRLLDQGKKSRANATYLEMHHPSKGRWYDLHYTYIHWVDGRKVSLCAVFDITDKKLYQQKIEQQANNDFLTGLYNRMCCERDLVHYVDEAKQNDGKGALLYLDLDDFKHINDGLGHQYGDVLLKAISHSLQRIDGIEHTCYRMGGDEFVIIIPESSYTRFEEIIEEIKIVFNKPWFLKGADYYCTTSMGIVTFPDEGETVQDLIKKADIAMYEAKKSGKNRTAYYADDADSLSNKRLDMEKNMREATADNYKEFEVYYQPIIDIRKDGSPCTGAEALIRWNSVELGFVSPMDFIPLAEYLGLINPIGNYVLREACMACKKWNESGHPYFKVNVNLSVVQLLQSDIVETIADTIQQTGINPRNLTLEVTESLAINDMARMKEILSNIKQLGVRIALDDFGTGYSSLNHIREIPLDVIKVDQSFVEDLAEDQYSQSFIKMVGELASAIGVKICVEGIETKEQFQVLENMNVRLIQGFYFDRPMKRTAFEEKYVNQG
ncbi:MAG TPA: EAL domain-containing protein [Lachnospiraceae bacterium]|nr:EAL domain-containing protein [Lachnospiraceae bacterium]